MVHLDRTGSWGALWDSHAVLLAHNRQLCVSPKPQQCAQVRGGRADPLSTRVTAQEGLWGTIIMSCAILCVFMSCATLWKSLSRDQNFFMGFQSFEFFSFICLKVRAGEVTENITMDSREARDATKLWRVFLTQHFLLQNSGQIQGYCCHIHLGGDNSERKDIRVQCTHFHFHSLLYSWSL